MHNEAFSTNPYNSEIHPHWPGYKTATCHVSRANTHTGLYSFVLHTERWPICPSVTTGHCVCKIFTFTSLTVSYVLVELPQPKSVMHHYKDSSKIRNM